MAPRSSASSKDTQPVPQTAPDSKPALSQPHLQPSLAQPASVSHVPIGAAPTTSHDLMRHAVAQAAMLAVPYIDSDSEDDPVPPSTATPQQQQQQQQQKGDLVVTTNDQQSANPLPPTEPICGPMSNHGAVEQLSSVDATVQASMARSNHDASTSTGAAKLDAVRAHHDASMADAKRGERQLSDTEPAAAAGVEMSSAGDPNASTDTINVSRSCLDGVVEQLANRISELEQIRERKKARMERLSSAAANLEHAAPSPVMWQQSAAMAAAAAASNPLNALALATPVLPGKHVVPPPPPPPPPDGAERKQSRYWTADEHERFLAAIKTCGPKNYVRIAELVGTRNAKQVRTHAQKFQKKLEREEAKRRDDLRRHGGAAAASSVSAAAMAAVAAAAAAMHQGRHDPAAALGPYAAHPHLLIPYGVTPAHPNGVAMFTPTPPAGASTIAAAAAAASAAAAAAAAAAQTAAPGAADGSSSTNRVSHEHPPTIEAPPEPEAVAAAVAEEAAALGNRVYSRPADGCSSPRADASSGGVKQSAVHTHAGETGDATEAGDAVSSAATRKSGSSQTCSKHSDASADGLLHHQLHQQHHGGSSGAAANSGEVTGAANAEAKSVA